MFQKYNILFDYDNQSIGFKGDDILDLTKAYSQWIQKNKEINNKKEKNENINYKEQILKISGIIVGLCIIIFVLFHQYRRDNKKLHSKLIEEGNNIQLNNQINNQA